MHLNQQKDTKLPLTNNPAIGQLASSLPLMFTDEGVRLTHRTIARDYEIDGKLFRWGDIESSKSGMQRLASRLVYSGLLPLPKGLNEKIKILSTSAHSGYVESCLADMLGKNYTVIASDLADVKRIGNHHGRSLRADASYLPVADKSINVVYDFSGALWYDAALGIKNAGYIEAFLKRTLAEYERILKDGGLVITDRLTLELINRALPGRDFKYLEAKFFVESESYGRNTYEFVVFRKKR